MLALRATGLCLVALLAAVLFAGCNSPYYADRGALAGGLGGAGVGALVGSASGHPGVGAAVGAGVGAITGGLIGAGMDDVAARNRAEIAAQMGRPLPPGAVSVNDVVTMTRAGVNEELILNQIRTSGITHPLAAAELVALQQQGVSTRVIATMQTASVPTAIAPVAAPPVVGPYYYPPPPPAYWAYPPPAYGVYVR